MSLTGVSRYRGSCIWIMYAFSATRVASKKTGMPRSLQYACTAFMLSMLTGWPPAMLTECSNET